MLNENSEEVLICARNGCDEIVHKKTHNQKYHNDICTKIATNERIMQNYYDDRARKQGKTRYCSKCEVTKLSRYNEGTICAPCLTESEIKANNSALDMLRGAVFGI